MYVCVSELGPGNGILICCCVQFSYNWMNFIRTVMLCVLVFVCSFALQPISVGILSGTHLAPQPATVSMVLEAAVLPLFRPLILELVMPALRGTLYRYNLPDATNLAAAVLVFLIAMYFQGFLLCFQ